MEKILIIIGWILTIMIYILYAFVPSNRLFEKILSLNILDFMDILPIILLMTGLYLSLKKDKKILVICAIIGLIISGLLFIDIKIDIEDTSQILVNSCTEFFCIYNPDTRSWVSLLDKRDFQTQDQCIKYCLIRQRELEI